MRNIIEEITNFIFIEDKPKIADAIMIVSGAEPRLGEKAAQLWKIGYAPICLTGGGISIKLGKFLGPKSKSDIYSGDYQTEYDFLEDVLLKNGVNKKAILGENKSSYTRENAMFAKEVCDFKGLSINKAILVCKSFHARRALMFYQSYFPMTQFYVVTIDSSNITKDTWYKNELGRRRVLGEIKRIGEQFNDNDIQSYLISNTKDK